MGHVPGYKPVQLPLQAVPLLPFYVHRLCYPIFKQPVALVVNRLPLFGTDNVGCNLLLDNSAVIRKGLLVQQPNQP